MEKDILNKVANIETGLEIEVLDDALLKEARINNRAQDAEIAEDLYEGVTENAPNSNTSEYKMVSYYSDNEELFNSQGS